MPTTRIPRPLECALDAIDQLLGVLELHPTTSLGAIVDRLPGAGQVLVSVDGGDPGPSGVEALAAALQVELGRARGARFALVSVRATAGSIPEEADLWAWRRLSRLHRHGPLTLLDWFVVTDDAILSLAELSGPPAPWDG